METTEPTSNLLRLPQQPHELHKYYAAAFNTGDVEQVLRLFEPQAQFVSPAGTVHTGLAAIRAELAGYLRRGGTMRITTRLVLEFEGFALLRSEWELIYKHVPGQSVILRGEGLEVGRRQANGVWQFVVDQPFGPG